LCKKVGPNCVSKRRFYLAFFAHHAWSGFLQTKKKWTNLVFILVHIWGIFCGSFWDQIGYRRGRTIPTESSGATKIKTIVFSKTLKNLRFFIVFGSRGFPREPQDAAEGF